MQKDIIATIYRLLSEDENIKKLVENRIYTFNSDGYRDEEDIDHNLAEITHILLNTNIKNRDIGLYESHYQVSAWAKNLEIADDIANAIIQCLSRYENAHGIERINLDSINNMRDPDSQAYGMHIRFIIVWRKK